uniref:Integrase core domain-containing protein n=1 Tax=Candidatus Kentrum sp. UNK TaxID=2126344 RepID=A0A451B613_9GAMM|nr:MAG: Integrase core domain-containing protein [Candidatus Kentron sp. UNK]VFK73733.1 MAG: Integrase core domain-containing protein [Candidatus Kentron sp. UNK]
MTVRDQQIDIYLSTKRSGATQITAAARAGFSERTARRIEKVRGREKKMQHWRTREDPFSEVWEQELEPLLKEYPEFSAVGLLRYLQERYPGQYSDGKLRTLQRRAKAWRAMRGPSKPVMFRQEREMGRRGLSDFTRFDDAGITIRGEAFSHCLYHFRLAFSGWCHVKVTPGPERYGALAEGLEGALWRLGGVPLEHRTDSLSSAYKNLARNEAEDITARYGALCRHYGMIPTRNNRGRGHENGAIESPHGHLKRRLREALAIRGSRDFDSVADYQHFVDIVTERDNHRKSAVVQTERGALKPLPSTRLPAYTERFVRVSTSATIRVDRVIYSVPARLIGERLRVHLYASHLECHVGARRVLDLPRVRSPEGEGEARRIDYRHLIGSLAEKPMALYRAQLRDDILPNETWRVVWRMLDRRLSPRRACRLMVGALKLAADCDCERTLGQFLLQATSVGKTPSLTELRGRFGPNVVPLAKTLFSKYGSRNWNRY